MANTSIYANPFGDPVSPWIFDEGHSPSLYNVRPLPFVISHAMTLNRIVRLGLPRGFPGRGSSALTFDDGPDPRSTPMILNTLERLSLKATFFLTGSKAEQYPSLVQEIQSAGHSIQLHGYRHISVWSQSREAVLEEVRHAKQAVDALLDFPTSWYRPAHGHWRPILRQGLRESGLHLCLWTLMPFEFHTSVTASIVVEFITSRLGEGDILVLHDQPKYLTSVLAGMEAYSDTCLARGINHAILGKSRRME